MSDQKERKSADRDVSVRRMTRLSLLHSLPRLCLCLSLIAGLNLKAADTPKKLLVVTVTAGFRHSSIETAEKVLAALADSDKSFTVDFVHQPEGTPKDPGRPPEQQPKETDDAFKQRTAAYSEALAKFNEAKKGWDDKLKAHLATTLTPEILKQYDGYIFANTTGELPMPDRDALINEVESGKAFIAMHAGGDTFHRFPRYIEMIGGEFDGHPWHEMVTMKVEDPQHPASAAWGKKEKFDIADEIYQYKNYSRAGKQVLISLDASNEETRARKKEQDGTEKTFFQRGKRDDRDYAVSWTRQQGQGKVFYTSLGHREEVWENPKYQAHILAGIKWALGVE